MFRVCFLTFCHSPLETVRFGVRFCPSFEPRSPSRPDSNVCTFVTFVWVTFPGLCVRPLYIFTTTTTTRRVKGAQYAHYTILFKAERSLKLFLSPNVRYIIVSITQELRST